MTAEIVGTILVAIIAALAAIGGPLWLDARKASRDAEAQRDATRAQAAELAARAHREALDAKDREIAYWRDRYLDWMERHTGRGERVS